MRTALMGVALVGAGVIFSLYGYTIPLAEGNHWVYSYHDSVHNSGNELYVSDSAYDSITTGIFEIFVDSLVTRNDSMVFSIITVDSGRTNSIKFDSLVPVKNYSDGYSHRHSIRYLSINDSIFILDSLGQWKKAGWQVDTVPYGVYPSDRGTSWDLTGPSGWPNNPNDWNSDAVPWFLNYPGPTNSTFTWTFENNRGYAANQRHSDSSYPAVVNGNKHWCYSTSIIDSNMQTNGASIFAPSVIENSNCCWIQNIGYGSFTVTNEQLIFFQRNNYLHRSTNWTLLSFNDDPVTLPSKVIRANPKQTLLSNKHNPYRKVFLLEGSHQPLNSSASIFNIRGQQLGKIQTAQIIIIKNR